MVNNFDFLGLEEKTNELPEFSLTSMAFENWLEECRNRGSKLAKTILQNKSLFEISHLELECNSFTPGSASYEYLSQLIHNYRKRSTGLNKAIKHMQHRYKIHKREIYQKSCQNN
ncbi:MAG: hypothetical protein J4451_02105 [DPANN group archaeon]|nr:hypothetical protein [DPANN group archaeon]